jgi:hypothetical protein
MINRKPEIRFRVVRDSTRKVMRSKIMKEYKKNEIMKSIKKKMKQNVASMKNSKLDFSSGKKSNILKV